MNSIIRHAAEYYSLVGLYAIYIFVNIYRIPVYLAASMFKLISGHVLYPKMMVGWDSRMSTEKGVVECVGILKN